MTFCDRCGARIGTTGGCHCVSGYTSVKKNNLTFQEELLNRIANALEDIEKILEHKL